MKKWIQRSFRNRMFTAMLLAALLPLLLGVDGIWLAISVAEALALAVTAALLAANRRVYKY